MEIRLEPKPSETPSKILIKPISDIWLKTKKITTQKQQVIETLEEDRFRRPNRARPRDQVKNIPSEMDGTFNIELEMENENLRNVNETLRQEVRKSLELLNQMEASYKQNVRQKNKAIKDNRSYSKLYTDIEAECNRLKNSYRLLSQENELLNEDREDKNIELREIEIKIDKLKTKNKKLKAKIKKYKHVAKNEEKREIQTSESVLEAERLRNENDDLKFEKGQLKQRLALRG